MAGGALVPSIIPAPFCDDLKKIRICDRNSAESDIGKGVREELYSPDILYA